MSELMEVTLLSCLITNNEDIVDVNITADQFLNSTYAQIFRAIKMMTSKGDICDLFTLADCLRLESNRNWFDYLTNLVENTSGSSKNVKGYCEAIKKSYDVRLAVSIGTTLSECANDESAIGNAIKSLMAMGREATKYEYSMKEGLQIALEATQKAAENPGGLIGIKTGLSELDELLGGWHNGELIIIGARPAMGKTAVLLNMLVSADVSVGLFSGEQGIGQIMERLLSRQSGVALSSMRNGSTTEHDWDMIEIGARKLFDLDKRGSVRFHDKPSPSIDDIEFTARRWKQQFGIKAIYIDYLQKMARDPKVSKIEGISNNVSRLKDLARELDIPVICLAQVSRECEKRPNKRPGMGDLADTSETEKEADQIILLYRDEFYNPDDTTDPGVIEFIIDKNRHGPVGTVKAGWDGKRMAISDYNYTPANQQPAQETTGGYNPGKAGFLPNQMNQG